MTFHNEIIISRIVRDKIRRNMIVEAQETEQRWRLALLVVIIVKFFCYVFKYEKSCYCRSLLSCRFVECLTCSLYACEVSKLAVLNNAAGIIVAHQHSNGDIIQNHRWKIQLFQMNLIKYFMIE